MIYIYTKTSKAVKRFRSVKRFEQWIDKTFPEDVRFHREYGNYYKILVNNKPAGYSISF